LIFAQTGLLAFAFRNGPEKATDSQLKEQVAGGIGASETALFLQPCYCSFGCYIQQTREEGGKLE